jgi:hypothetical protein
MTIEEQSYTLGQLLEDLGLVFDKKYQPLYKQILDTFGDNAHITRPIEQSTLPDKEACFKVLRAMPPFVRPAYRPVHELTMMGRVYENLYAPPVASDSGKEQQTVLSEKLLSLLAEPISLAVYEEIKEALPKLNQTATKFNAIVSDIQGT